MIGRSFWRRAAAAAIAIGFVVGISTSSGAALPPLPPGSVVTCSQISGFIALRPGIGATGTSTGVKWQLKAVANNCTVTGGSSAGTVPPVIAGAIVRASGYFIGGNTCAAAQVAANYGASTTMNVSWISTPALASTIYSAVPTGSFSPGTTIDATGITQNRPNIGPTPVSLQLGGDWTAASAALLASDCSGPAPILRTLAFQTPATTSPHNPAFIATI